MGLEAVRVDREVTLQDNKRTDLLIRYGLCNPIMVELKLLHNDEIQSKKQRQAYRDKFIQYTNATNACLSVFWVFDVHKKGSDAARFKDLEVEYKDLDNTLILLTDCKCSSGIETGLPKNKVSIRPTTGIKPLYTTIATVTMNLIVSAAIVLLNPYVTVYISYKIPPFALSVHIPDVSTSIYVEVDSKVLLGLPSCDKAFVR